MDGESGQDAHSLLFRHDRVREIEAVDASDAAALIASFGRMQEISEDVEHRAEHFLAGLRDAGHWLSCRCATNAAGEHPLMVPRLHNGVLHIVRIRDLAHAEDCPFYRDPNEDEDTGGSARQERSLAPVKSGWLTLADRQAATREASRNDAEPAERRRRTPPIAAVLFTALEEMGYHRVEPDDVFTARGQDPKGRMSRKPYEQLRNLDDRAVGEGAHGVLTGRDLICRFLPALPKFLADMPSKARLFKPGHRVQGLFIGQVQGIERVGHQGFLIWEGKAGDGRETVRVQVSGTLTRFGAGDAATGPFWCAGALGQLGDGAFGVVNAFVHPVYAKTLLLPVDGAHERAAAALLLGQIVYWSQAPRVRTSIVLEKPLFDRAGKDGEAIRPDFRLILPDHRQIAIEVMNGLSDGVRQAKLARHEAIRAGADVAELVVYDEGSTTPVEFQRRLTSVVLRLLNR